MSFFSGESSSNRVRPPQYGGAPLSARVQVPMTGQPPPRPSQQQARQEWEQEAQLREELWRKQQSQQPRQQQPHGHAAPSPNIFGSSGHLSGGSGGGGRRPSPYRDEAIGAVGGPKGGALAPPAGVDAAFDARVMATAARKSILRDALWLKLGGSGEPAKAGELPSFDATVAAAWAEVQGRHKADEARESAAADGHGHGGGVGSGGGGVLGGPSGTSFGSDVAAEMERIEAELMEELARTSPSKAKPPQSPTFQHQQQMQQQMQRGRNPPFGGPQQSPRLPFGGPQQSPQLAHQPAYPAMPSSSPPFSSAVRAPPVSAPWLPRATDAMQPSPRQPFPQQQQQEQQQQQQQYGQPQFGGQPMGQQYQLQQQQQQYQQYQQQQPAALQQFQQQQQQQFQQQQQQYRPQQQQQQSYGQAHAGGQPPQHTAAAPWLQQHPPTQQQYQQPPQQQFQQQAPAPLTGRRGQFSGRGASSLTFG